MIATIAASHLAGAVDDDVKFDVRFVPGDTHVYKYTNLEKVKVRGGGRTIVIQDTSTSALFSIKVRKSGTPEQIAADLSFEQIKADGEDLKINDVSIDWDRRKAENGSTNKSAQDSANYLAGFIYTLTINEADGTLLSAKNNSTDPGGIFAHKTKQWSEAVAKDIEAAIRTFTEGLPEPAVPQGFSWSRSEKLGTLTRFELPEAKFGLPIDFVNKGGASPPRRRTPFPRITFSSTSSRPELMEPLESGDAETEFLKSAKIKGSIFYDPARSGIVYYEKEMSWVYSGEDLGDKFKSTVTKNSTIEFVSFTTEREDVSGTSAATAHRALVPQRIWRDSKGRKLTATLLRLDGSTGTFARPDGTEFNYEIPSLSQEDQSLIKAAGNPTNRAD